MWPQGAITNRGHAKSDVVKGWGSENGKLKALEW